MNTETGEYSEYTVCVGNDPTNYGDCSAEQAIEIAGRLQDMIEARFPGISVRRTNEIGVPTPTVGPSRDVADEIHCWVQENWTAAL